MIESCDDTIDYLFTDLGYSIERIAACLGIDTADVCRALGASYLLHDLPAPPGPLFPRTRRWLTPEQREEIGKVYLAGGKCKDIAEMADITIQHVHKLTRAARTELKWQAYHAERHSLRC